MTRPGNLKRALRNQLSYMGASALESPCGPASLFSLSEQNIVKRQQSAGPNYLIQPWPLYVSSPDAVY